jgi:hypothetical protein
MKTPLSTLLKDPYLLATVVAVLGLIGLWFATR